MGWCSATEIFDTVAEALLSDEPVDKKETLMILAEVLRYMDWDCQQDSEYWDHPVVQEIFRELEPEWFEDEDEDDEDRQYA